MAVPAEVGVDYTGLAFMAQSPGKQENSTGRPLVGPAGRVFERLLGEAGLLRSQTLLMNRVRCHPPRNRLQDYPEALVECAVWTQAELGEYSPKVVVLMGREAIEMAFGKTTRVGAVVGHARMDGRIWVATYHPAAVLRNSELGEQVVRDFKLGVELCN